MRPARDERRSLWRLPAPQRRQVVAALEDGAPVADPALAPVVVAQAQRELYGAGRRFAVGLGRAWGFVVLVVTLAAALTSAWSAAAFGVGWTSLWLVSEWVRHRSRRRLEAAIAANRSIGGDG